MRGLVYAKLGVFVVSAVAMCAWTLTKAGGVGEVARQPGTAHGSTKAWLIVRFFLLGAANCATFASNAADFQRYATKPSDVVAGNLVGFPLSNVSSASLTQLAISMTDSDVAHCCHSWQPRWFQLPSRFREADLVTTNVP